MQTAQAEETVQTEETTQAEETALSEETAQSEGAVPSEADSSEDEAVSGKNIDYAKVFPSWYPDSESLRELVDFVDACTDESSADYLDPADRIAVFDMDGTILCEKAPVYVDYCLTMYRVLDDPNYNATEEERDAMQQIRDHAYSEGKTFIPEGIDKNDLVATAFAGRPRERGRVRRHDLQSVFLPPHDRGDRVSEGQRL